MELTILAITALCTVTAVKWLQWRISTLALSRYLVKNGIKEPSDTELKECSKYAIKNMFTDIAKH